MLFRIYLFLIIGLAANPGLFTQDAGTVVDEIKINSDFYFGQESPGPIPVLFAPDYFSHEEGYHSPLVFSGDLTEVYWSPMERNHVLFCAKYDNGKWSAPQELTFGLSRGVGDPFISNTGHRLYFLSFAAPDGTSGPERERIWYAEKSGGAWGDPVCLDPLLSMHPTHWKGSVAANGTLYFTSEIDISNSGQGIYYMAAKEGIFEQPLRMSESVNKRGWEFGPCVAPDESFLIFTRRDNTTRKADLYISFKSDNGGWSTAVELGPGINSDENDLCASLSPDGKYMFFLSTRDGRSRIYWVEIAGIIKSLIKE